jgi:hypothetical protein
MDMGMDMARIWTQLANRSVPHVEDPFSFCPRTVSVDPPRERGYRRGIGQSGAIADEGDLLESTIGFD